MKNTLVFNCSKCGSENLGYQQWVESCSPVVIDSDGHLEYMSAVVDTDNALGAVGGYACGDCKHPLNFCGCRIETEAELVSYLSLDPANREEQEKQYQEGINDEAEAGEQRKEA